MSQSFGGCGSLAEGSWHLLKEASGVEHVCEARKPALRDRRGCRRGTGQPVQPEVCRWRAKLSGGLHDGGPDGSPSPVWKARIEKDPQSLAVPSRVAEVVSISLEACLPSSSVVCRELENGMSGACGQALFNLLQVSTYHRPGALLQLRRLGLVRPTGGVTNHWPVVTSLAETADVSKTGTKDDSVLLDSEWLQFAGPLKEELSKGDKLERVWAFDCPEYRSVFRGCCMDLKIELVPYQARHSGPSIDRAKTVRSQEEVRKRGGWLSKQSVARYEKAGRLAATWQRLDVDVQLACRSAEPYLEEIMLGHSYPVIPLPGR